jgi:Family of unknown function (DUF5681)
MANEQNLTPFQPGQKVKGRGRPKGSINMATRVRKILNKKIDWDKINVKDTERLEKRYGKKPLADAMILVQASKALTGDTQAFNALREAGWGRMVNVEGEADIQVVHIMKPEKLALAQIEQAAEQLRQRAARAVEAEVIDGVDSPTGSADLRPLGP